MPYCPKCGNKVDESMTFCPRCGASLRMEAPSQTPPPTPTAPSYQPPMRYEKGEKQEKHEKGEKQEKGGSSIIGYVVAGFVLIFIGIVSYLTAVWNINGALTGFFWLLFIGILIILVGLYYGMRARRYYPRPT